MDADRTDQAPTSDRRALLARVRRIKRGSLAAALVGFAALVGLAASVGTGGGGSPTSSGSRVQSGEAVQPATGADDDSGSDWGATPVSPAPATQAPAATSGAS